MKHIILIIAVMVSAQALASDRRYTSVGQTFILCERPSDLKGLFPDQSGMRAPIRGIDHDMCHRAVGITYECLDCSYSRTISKIRVLNSNKSHSMTRSWWYTDRAILESQSSDYKPLTASQQKAWDKRLRDERRAYGMRSESEKWVFRMMMIFGLLAVFVFPAVFLNGVIRCVFSSFFASKNHDKYIGIGLVGAIGCLAVSIYFSGIDMELDAHYMAKVQEMNELYEQAKK